MRALVIAVVVVSGVVLADVVLKNGGSTIGPVQSINCGGGATCSRSGTTGTISVDAGANFNLWDEGVDAGTVNGLSCVGPGVTCTKIGTQSQLYVDAGTDFTLWDESVDAGTIVAGINCVGTGIACTRVGTQAVVMVDATTTGAASGWDSILTGTASTSSTTPTACITWTPSASSVETNMVTMTGWDATAPTIYAAYATVTLWRDGSSAPVITNNTGLGGTNAPYSSQVSGNAVDILVTAATTNSITWRCVMRRFIGP